MRDYSDRLAQLYGGAAGEWDALEIRQFEDDVEAYELLDQYYDEIETAFNLALANAIELWGPPAQRWSWSDEEADQWLGRTGVSFLKIVLWPQNQEQYFYLLTSHEDRECPIALVAGVSDSES